MVVGFGRKRELVLLISLSVINKYNWSWAIIYLDYVVDYVIFQKPLLLLPGEALDFPILLTSCQVLSFALANEIQVERIYVYLWAEALSQNIVSYILFFLYYDSQIWIDASSFP